MMSFEDIVLYEVQRNPRLTHAELTEIFSGKIKAALDHWRREGRIVTEDGVKGSPFRYKIPTDNIRRV